jgi:hypothetical protein
VATTGNVSLSGFATIDGVSLTSGDRVLVIAQTDPKENGIYEVRSSAWVRAPDATVWVWLQGAQVWVEEGAVWSDTCWLHTGNKGGSLGSTNVNWVQVNSSVPKAGFYSTATHAAGTVISIPQTQHRLKSGRALNVMVLDDATGVYEIPGIVIAANGDVSIMLAASAPANSKRINIAGYA